MCAPKGNVKFGGSQKCVATRPGSVFGGSFMARYAAPAISPNDDRSCRSCCQVHAPPANVTSSDSSSIAPNFLIFAFSSCSAKYSAVPPTAVPRLPNVPMPYCTIAVSPCSTRTSSMPHAQFVGGDLREGGLLALPVRRGAGQHRDLAGRLDLHRGAFPSARRRRRRGPERADLAVGGNADAHQLALLARLGLLLRAASCSRPSSSAFFSGAA